MAKPDKNARQQILDKLRDVDTVLVAVNSSPSVDELSAALGTTLALNKIGKHATCVFSGEVPMAIEFLEPGKTFENTVDSLRDFIIALDKEKADHLRYKVEGEMVKIFITPYRTTIDDKDLEFSQGDYNVEMVLAIGVRDEDDLDRALADHGRIMHDATVAGISLGSDSSEIGSITWHDNDASSYSELMADLVTKLRSDKDVLDEQIATALMTGIVAATDRFSNAQTSSNAMTLAAQLMAAGANQQLIATKLEQAEELSSPVGISMSGVTSESGGQKSNSDGSTNLNDDVMAKVDRRSDTPEQTLEKLEEQVKDRQAADGSMTISHTRRGDVDEVAEQVAKQRQDAATERAEAILAQGLAGSSAPSASAPGLSVADLQSDLRRATDEIETDSANLADQATASPVEASLPPVSTPPEQTSLQSPTPVADDGFIETPIAPLTTVPASEPPSFGGVLNATSEQAAADKRAAEEKDRNKKLLSHDGGAYTAAAPAGYPAVNSFNDSGAGVSPASATDDLGVVSSRGVDIQPLSQPPAPEPFQAASSPTLAEIDSQNRGAQAPVSTSDAMAEALSMANSTNQQQQHVPDVSALPPIPPLPSAPQVADPSVGGLPPLPPMPDFSALPPLPPSPEPQMPTVSAINQGAVPPQMQPQPQSNDPAAFQIPGQ